MKQVLIFAVATVAAAFISFPCVAQEKAPTAAVAAKEEKKKKGAPIVLEEIVIEGRIRKPQALYVLSRSSFGYKIMEMKADYIDDVLSSVKNEVF